MALTPVVVGTDGSEESLRAVEWAAHEARRRRVPLRIVSAPAMPPRMRTHDSDSQNVTGELSAASARALRDAVTRSEEVAPGLLVDAALLMGPPAIALTESGAGALMLVTGARGAGGFSAMLLGSVSRYAAMHASCPVVVVRQETSAVHLEVVVGVRDLQDTTATLGFAFAEAALRHATLVAVHSWSGLPAVSWRPVEPGRLTAEIDSALAAVLAPWREKYPDVPVRRDVVGDHPGHVLASYTPRADLVVLGRHGPETGPAVGGIQHAVLSHARGPVAIVPAG
jgi:nucleotide-binding universal stress UspA family protein